MRLIDADKVSAAIEKLLFNASNLDAVCYDLGISDALSVIEDAETVDAVQVVRCRDCKYCHDGHYENEGEEPYIKRRCTNKYALGNSGYGVFAAFHCAYGDRKEETE